MAKRGRPKKLTSKLPAVLYGVIPTLTSIKDLEQDYNNLLDWIKDDEQESVDDQIEGGSGWNRADFGIDDNCAFAYQPFIYGTKAEAELRLSKTKGILVAIVPVGVKKTNKGPIIVTVKPRKETKSED